MSCVLTLALDEDSQSHFEALRQRWFPPERNLIPAHITLFHTLPESDEVIAELDAVAAQSAPFTLLALPPRSIGRGVAFFFETSPQAIGVHRRLSAAFAQELTAQDRQGFRPHVVVQNKARPVDVADALSHLQAGFTPVSVQAVGLDLWRYLDGPWLHLRRFTFS